MNDREMDEIDGKSMKIRRQINSLIAVSSISNDAPSTTAKRGHHDGDTALAFDRKNDR